MLNEEMLFEGAIVHLRRMPGPGCAANHRLTKADIEEIKAGRMSASPVLLTEEILRLNGLEGSELLKGFRYVHEVQLLFKLMCVHKQVLI